jgi:hypothetical protein
MRRASRRAVDRLMPQNARFGFAADHPYYRSRLCDITADIEGRTEMSRTWRDGRADPSSFVNLSGATTGTTISKSQGTGPSSTMTPPTRWRCKYHCATQVATFTVTRTGTNATAPFDVSSATADSPAIAADGPSRRTLCLKDRRVDLKNPTDLPSVDANGPREEDIQSSALTPYLQRVEASGAPDWSESTVEPKH